MSDLFNFNIKKSSLIIFIITLFLFKLPNFYFIPILKISFLTTHVLARCLLFVIFILNIKKITDLFSRNKIFVIILLFFLIQSLSILQSINNISFLYRYKEIALGFIAFWTAVLFQKKYKLIINVLLITTIMSVLIQLAFITFPIILTKLFNYILYYKVYDLVVINLARGRTYFETFDEVVIPVILYLFIIDKGKKSRSKKFILLPLFIIITMLAIVSGWRTRLIMAFFGSVTSALFVTKKAPYLLVLALIYVFVFFLSRYINMNNAIARFELNDENTFSLEYRTDQLRSVFTIIKSYPLGIGLGNYFEYLPSHEKNSRYLIIDEIQKQQDSIAQENVHNIFGLITVESGIPAIVVFITLLLSFIRNDYYLIKMKDYPKISFMIGFWLMFIYSFFNPLIPGVANYLFWFLRGYSIIIKVRKQFL